MCVVAAWCHPLCLEGAQVLAAVIVGVKYWMVLLMRASGSRHLRSACVRMCARCMCELLYFAAAHCLLPRALLSLFGLCIAAAVALYAGLSSGGTGVLGACGTLAGRQCCWDVDNVGHQGFLRLWQPVA